ncbi:MAG: CocE/NonD family hydrolase [Planctomycetota bacterium]|nr:CocE/NonD family hydrolase [Planctomycetota bacterium]
MSTPAHVRQSRILRNVMVPMRDGVKLATTVFLPPADEPCPAALVRTAYNRAWGSDCGFNAKGIAFVVQDVRGRYGSEGEYYPFDAEEADGLDTLDWLLAQPWCNGKVGMFGDSYLAGTQFAVARPASKAGKLVALNPRFMTADPWLQGYYCGGAFSLALTFTWLCLEVGSRTSESSLLPLYDVPKLLRHLPLESMDEAFGDRVQSYRDYTAHDSRDAFWQNLCWRDALPEVDVPVLLTAGWYDYYPAETFRDFHALHAGKTKAGRSGSHRLIMGPWPHGISGGTRLGHLDFGPEALRENGSTNRWLECLLKGGKPSDFQAKPIRIFVMGANVWRDEEEWPLARTRYTPYYIHSGGKANSLLGDGSLSPAAPGDEPADHFTYDPADPVPTLGGNHSVGPYNPGLYEICLPGPYDQRPVERRDDVLVFTTEVLADDLEVTGPVTVKLFAATSAPDTDFVARLSDVHPDGRAINITEGVIRARYRALDWAKPTLVEPGRVHEYTIELQPTSNVFLKGHRLRLDITSSNFPLWDRNLNTGEHPAKGTRMQKAEQTILHDRKHASCVILPVIPASKAKAAPARRLSSGRPKR